MNAQQENRLYRLRDIVGDRRSNPPTPGLLPIGKSTWLDWVAKKKAPAGLKLSGGVTAWRASDVEAFINNAANDPSPASTTVQEGR